MEDLTYKEILSSSMGQASYKCEMPRLELKSSRSFLAIKRCEGTKLEKLLSDHETQFISWRIYAPLVVKLLSLLFKLTWSNNW